MKDDTPALWERWKPVRGFEGLYLVSDTGRVESIPRLDRLGRAVGGKILKPSLTTAGYPFVSLAKDGRVRQKLVAVLVAEAFIRPRPKGLDLCHNDGDKSNSKLENLRWDTRRANALDKQRHGTDYQLNKEECRNGHAYSEENTYRISRSDGRKERRCKTCQSDSDARQRRNRPPMGRGTMEEVPE